MKKLPLFAIIFFAVSAIAIAAGSMSPTRKLQLAESIIANFYVDTINEDKIVEAGIINMLKELDPHSSYTNADETKALNEPLDGTFSGIGVTFNMNQDTLYILQTVSGGPSEKVGILAGDRILTVNDSAISGVKMKNSDIMKRLRGPKGTKVNVKVLRRFADEKDQVIDFTITRDEIPILSIDAAYMATPTTGYVKLNKFGATTYKEFIEAIAKLQRQGMKDIVIDLTSNGGGYLAAAADILGEILEPGSLAVYTEGLRSPRQTLQAKPAGSKPLLENARVAVMVDQYSASAAEILTGAVQDWDRGVIVGRRTFGKGLVQRPFPFPDGSMIKLTIAHYYTPSGRDIQKPYTKGNNKDYSMDILDRYNRGELMHADSIHYADSLKVATLKNKREIYGGGGISPDLFVPLDTMDYSDYYRKLMAKGIYNQFAIQYTDNHRKEIKKKYKTPADFISNFEVDDFMLETLKDMGEKEKITFKEEEFNRSKDVIKTAIKGIIGRDIYDEETFYKIWNARNPIYTEAIRLIESPQYKSLLKE